MRKIKHLQGRPHRHYIHVCTMWESRRYPTIFFWGLASTTDFTSSSLGLL
jgi:hypothetical protein